MPNLTEIVEMAESLESTSVHVEATRCVAVRNRNAKCRKCIEACPAEAITIKPNKLNLSASACVGCGACTTVCPTDALVSIAPPDADLAEKIVSACEVCESVAVFACARMEARHIGDMEKYACVPCLARIEESLLLSLAAHGASEIVLVDGTCKTCKYRACVAGIDATVTSANVLIAAQGSRVRVSRASEFPHVALSLDAQKTYRDARRDFFSQAGISAKSAAKTVAEKTIEKVLGADDKKTKNLRDALRMSDKGALPQFETRRREMLLDAMYELGVSAASDIETHPLEGDESDIEACPSESVASDTETRPLESVASEIETRPLESVASDTETYVSECAAPYIETRLFGSVEIDLEKCTSCFMCTVFCPTGALKKSEQAHDVDTGETLEFSVADCVQCNMCADVCMKKCLEVVPRVSTAELFDFEPRLIELPKAPARNGLFGKKK